MRDRRVAFALVLAALLQTPAFTQTASVLQHGTSPLITFRILFMTGSAFDPTGKEGLASLTAAMLGEGGSRSKAYQQIVDEMYPMATSLNWQVDKEMTVFTGTTHVENLDRFYGLINDMLLDPGFRQEDFTRVRDEAVNFLKVSLRESNDEELGISLQRHLYRSPIRPPQPRNRFVAAEADRRRCACVLSRALHARQPSARARGKLSERICGESRSGPGEAAGWRA